MNRILRGLRVLQKLLGSPFVVACLGLIALLLRALITADLGLGLVGLLALALLLIRAHDMGEEREQVPPAPRARLDYPSEEARAAMALGNLRVGHDL